MALPTITVRIPELDATFDAKLVSVRASSKSEASFTSLCPQCDTPTKLNQKLICPNHEGQFGRDDIHKGREVSKGRYVKVTDEEIAALKEPELTPNLLELSVFRSADIETATQPDEHAYFLAVTEGSAAKMLFDLLVANPDKALVGELNTSKKQKMFRLTTWNKSLFLQELIRPTEIAAQVEVGGTEYKERFFPIYEELLAESVDDFDPKAFESHIKARIKAMDEGLGVGVEVTTQREVNNTTLEELEAMLEAKRAAKKSGKGKKAA